MSVKLELCMLLLFISIYFVNLYVCLQRVLTQNPAQPWTEMHRSVGALPPTNEPYGSNQTNLQREMRWPVGDGLRPHSDHRFGN
jgi:hypothetical protein